MPAFGHDGNGETNQENDHPEAGPAMPAHRCQYPSRRVVAVGDHRPRTRLTGLRAPKHAGRRPLSRIRVLLAVGPRPRALFGNDVFEGDRASYLRRRGVPHWMRGVALFAGGLALLGIDAIAIFAGSSSVGLGLLLVILSSIPLGVGYHVSVRANSSRPPRST